MPVQPHESTYRVRGFDCGYGGPFKPFALANFFQEAAGDHAEILGVGMQAMFAAGRTWMLSRTDTRVERLPREGDLVTVRTWPAGIDRLFAIRHLELRDEAGGLLAGAAYAYLIVDMERRRPLRPERILPPGMVGDLPAPFADLSPGTGQAAAAGPVGAPGPIAGSVPSFRIKASPRHIDHNGHVNNGHLIDWLCDAAPRAERRGGALRRLKVDFLAEVLEGDELSVSWAPAAGGGGIGSVDRDGTQAARAFVDWA